MQCSKGSQFSRTNPVCEPVIFVFMSLNISYFWTGDVQGGEIDKTQQDDDHPFFEREEKNGLQSSEFYVDM